MNVMKVDVKVLPAVGLIDGPAAEGADPAAKLLGNPWTADLSIDHRRIWLAHP